MSNWRDSSPNPYDPNSPDYQAATPPPEEIIRQAVRAGMMALRVWLPGVITDVLGNQKVNVQPLLQYRAADGIVNPDGTNGTLITRAIIQNVMVQMPIGVNYSVKYPIAVGDTGMIAFCDRSLAVWSAGDGSVADPADSRMHDLTDAVFIPGLVPFANQTDDETDDLVVTAGDAQFRILQSGGFKFKNSSQELITNLVNLVNALSTASTVAGGPFIPSVVTALEQIAENLQSLQG